MHGRARDPSLLNSIKTGFGGPLASYCSLEAKWLRCEADHLSPYNAARMDGAVPPLEFAFLVTCLIKHRANLPLPGLYYLLRYCHLGCDTIWFGGYVS